MRVALFTTCLAEALAPRALKATVLVLERCGVRPEVPAAQTCCGQPMLSNGLPHEAESLARRMIAIFAGFDAVVTPSGSCCSVVRERFPGLFPAGSTDRAAAEGLAARTFELIEFLEVRLGIDPATLGGSGREPITCHDACHLRGLHRLGCTGPVLARRLRRGAGAARRFAMLRLRRHVPEAVPRGLDGAPRREARTRAIDRCRDACRDRAGRGGLSRRTTSAMRG